ncbi:META domain-containing protein [Salinicola sp. 4072]|uniref:META domain-containing protein n=1 Tax=Salinicola sp. 4072 TaxID=3082157 RepID=UPI002FCBEC24
MRSFEEDIIVLSRLKPLLAVSVTVAVAMIVSGCATSSNTVDDTQTANEALVGTYWKLMTLDGQPVAVADNQREAHLILGEDGRVSGSTGCNRLMGSYRLEGDTLTFSRLASTRMACPGDMAMLEQAWLAALAETAHYSIADQSLELQNADDRALAEFKANALY